MRTILDNAVFKTYAFKKKRVSSIHHFTYIVPWSFNRQIYVEGELFDSFGAGVPPIKSGGQTPCNALEGKVGLATLFLDPCQGLMEQE